MLKRPLRPLLCLTLIACLAACAREEIKTYKVAKEKPSSPTMGEMPAAHPGMDGQMPEGHPPVGGNQMPEGHPPIAPGALAAAEGPAGMAQSAALSWEAPSDWQAKALGQMRQGSYTVKGENGTELDLSIFVFPGAAGGLVENINRWRGQISLPPIDKNALADETSALKTDSGLDLIIVDLRGTGGESILGAILTQGSQSWFFKLKGPSTLAQAKKDSFLAFLKTVKTR